MQIFSMFLLCFLQQVNIYQCRNTLYNMVYWDLRPYIFTNQKNEIDGIFPKTFRAIASYCFENKNDENNTAEFVQYRHRSNNQEEFLQLFRNLSISYKTNQLAGISRKNAMWGPMVHLRLDTEHLRKRKLSRYTFHRSTAIAVIVTRDKISLYNKFIRRLSSCKHTLILAALLIVMFGILIWILERKDNNNFNESFLAGTLTGIWWSFITLTTVGYGDVVPKSLLGRILSCVLMYTGMVILCVITGTVTAAVSGTGDLGIYKRRVAVVEDSYEERIAREDYKADNVSVTSYEALIREVHRGNVFAGFMNEEIAFAYQDNITANNVLTPLKIIYTVPAIIDISVLLSNNNDASPYWKCAVERAEETWLSAFKEYQPKLKIESVYYDSVSNLLDRIFFRILIGIVASLTLMGTMFHFKRQNNLTWKDKQDNDNVDKTVKELKMELKTI
ncbi:uncharacterized protein LOC130623949 [Hydractinia symbiolongicarpus]|uniref:uncharacterized protein LOC130623949 n=1 Tax=Hydractinia symbiolongicarpus TaxID=13093 RepID=UPI00254BCA3F|nr:uncharacterized protein LOC130623949 [Hydractinia symbiolongicarpus]